MKFLEVQPAINTVNLTVKLNTIDLRKFQSLDNNTTDQRTIWMILMADDGKGYDDDNDDYDDDNYNYYDDGYYDSNDSDYDDNDSDDYNMMMMMMMMILTDI